MPTDSPVSHQQGTGILITALDSLVVIWQHLQVNLKGSNAAEHLEAVKQSSYAQGHRKAQINHFACLSIRIILSLAQNSAFNLMHWVCPIKLDSEAEHILDRFCLFLLYFRGSFIISYTY